MTGINNLSLTHTHIHTHTHTYIYIYIYIYINPVRKSDWRWNLSWEELNWMLYFSQFIEVKYNNEHTHTHTVKYWPTVSGLLSTVAVTSLRLYSSLSPGVKVTVDPAMKQPAVSRAHFISASDNCTRNPNTNHQSVLLIRFPRGKALKLFNLCSSVCFINQIPKEKSLKIIQSLFT
jgi:hypothetical protein